MYLNKVFVFGNVTRDPELKALPSGSKVCSMSLATNRVWKDKSGAKQESTDYHNVVVFGRQAETVSQYLKKGSSLLVEGRLQTRAWDGTDGQKRYRTEIVADRIQFGQRSGGQSNNQNSNSGAQSKVESQEDSSKDIPSDTIEYPQDEINPDDIPF